MAAPACWRCTGRALFRSSSRSRSSSASRLPASPATFTIPSAAIGSGVRALHTTPPLGKKPDARPKTVHKPLSLNKKKKTAVTVKKPEIGYRRALRKAIILANSNAPVLELPDLTAKDLSDSASVGKAFNIIVEDLEKLRQLEVFQKKQMWQYFSRPMTLIRNESVGIARAMESVERYEPPTEIGADAGESEAAIELGRGAAGSGAAVGEPASLEELSAEDAEAAIADEYADEEADGEFVLELKSKLRKIKEATASIGLRIEEASQRPETPEVSAFIKEANSQKQKLDKVTRRIIPLLNYHSKLQKRRLERQEKRAGSNLATMQDFETILRQEEWIAEDQQFKKEKRAKEKLELQQRSSRPLANYVVTGKAGTGKSILLLHATVAAIQRSWVVIPISNAHDVVIGTTAFELNPDTGRYVQRDYLRTLLGRIGKANAQVLLKTKTTEDIQIGATDIKAGSSLISLIEVGSSGPEYSYEVFTALLAELEKPGAPPVLLTLDNLEYAMRPVCGYKSPEFNDVHSVDLDIIHTFCEYLSGRRKFSRQMVLAATTSELSQNPSLELVMQGKPLPGIGKYDYRIPEALGTAATTIVMKGLNREQTRNFLEFYKRCGLWDYSWSRSVPIGPALEHAGLTPQEYMKLRGIEDLAAPKLETLKEEQEPESLPSSITVAEITETLELGRLDREKNALAMRQKTLTEYLERPPTEHEVIERHVLTGGVPRELLKLCLRVQGSLNMA